MLVTSSAARSVVLGFVIVSLVRLGRTIWRHQRNNNLGNDALKVENFNLDKLQKELLKCGAKLEAALGTIASSDNAIAYKIPKNYPIARTVSNNATTFAKKNSTNTIPKKSAAICVMQKGGLHYIDEWVDYHLALGFHTIYIYDNSNDFELEQWAASRNPYRVVVHHLPGAGQQLLAHETCLQEQRLPNTKSQPGHSSHGSGKHTGFLHDWLAYIDIDEFIVLKQHSAILDLLEDVVPSDMAGLVLNRFNFYFHADEWSTPTEPLLNKDTNTADTNYNRYQHTYEPIPVLKRFQRRVRNADTTVKTISKTDQIENPEVHYPHYKGRQHFKVAVNTQGDAVIGARNSPPTANVAVIHHYQTKSLQEYQSKCLRGDARHGSIDHIANTSNQRDQTPFRNNKTNSKLESDIVQPTMKGFQMPCRPRKWIIEHFRNKTMDGGGMVLDDSAWKFLSNAVSRYRRYNSV